MWLSFCCIFEQRQQHGLPCTRPCEGLKPSTRSRLLLFLQPPKLCHQVRVDVRRPGVDLQLQHCQIEERESCKNGQELQEFSFKTSDCDSKCYQKTLSNVTKNSTILMCKDGICKEYSSEYRCDNVQTYLDVIQDGNQCDCQAYAGTYYPVVEYLHLSDSECPKKTYEYFLGCHQVKKFLKNFHMWIHFSVQQLRAFLYASIARASTYYFYCSVNCQFEPFVQFCPFLSIIFHFVNLVHFCRFCPFLSIFVHFCPFHPFLSIIFHFVNFCLFCPILSIFVQFVNFFYFLSRV